MINTGYDNTYRGSTLLLGVLLGLCVVLLLAFSCPASAQTNFCTNPSLQTRAEKGTPLTLAEFDQWLVNVRYVCTAADSPADEECWTYESTGDTFEWQPCGTGSGDSVQVGGVATEDVNLINTSAVSWTLNAATAPDEVSATIPADGVTEAMLKSVNAPTDEYCFTYEATTGDFEWQVCGGGAPTDAEYLTSALNGTLSAERVFQSGTNTTFATGVGTAQVDVADAAVGTKGVLQLTGDLSGTSTSPSVVDDSHAHTTTTVSGLDISADTNLAVTPPIVLTDDTISLTQNAGTDITADLEEETHATEHQNGGADEISVAGLSGALADPQLAGTIDDAANTAFDTADTPIDGEILKYDLASGLIRWAAAGSASFTSLDTDYGAETITSDFDFGGGTLQVPNSATLPGTCDVGDAYMDTDATTGQRWYLCESTNTWALQGGSGSGSDPWAGQYHPDREPTTCTACEEWAGGTAALTWRWGNQGDTSETLELDTARLQLNSVSLNRNSIRWTTGTTSGSDFVISTKMSTLGLSNSGTSHDLSGVLVVLVSGTEATPTQLFEIDYWSGGPTFRTLTRSSYTSSAGNITSVTINSAFDDEIKDLGVTWYFQIRYTATTKTLDGYVSLDGMDWRLIGSYVAAAHPTASHGYGVVSGGTTDPINRFHWWRERTDVAGLTGEVGE